MKVQFQTHEYNARSQCTFQQDFIHHHDALRDVEKQVHHLEIAYRLWQGHSREVGRLPVDLYSSSENRTVYIRRKMRYAMRVPDLR